MNEKLIIDLFSLKEKINTSNEVSELKKAEEKMLSSLDFAQIVEKKEYLINDISKIEDSDKEKRDELIKNLSLIKIELENLDVVKTYNDKYKQVKKMYLKVEKIIFSNFKSKDFYENNCW